MRDSLDSVDNSQDPIEDWCMQVIMKCNLCLGSKPLVKFESHQGLAIYICGDCQLTIGASED